MPLEHSGRCQVTYAEGTMTASVPILGPGHLLLLRVLPIVTTTYVTGCITGPHLGRSPSPHGAAKTSGTLLVEDQHDGHRLTLTPMRNRAYWATKTPDLVVQKPFSESLCLCPRAASRFGAE